MSTATLAGCPIQVDGEGFLVEPGEWDEEVGEVLATNIGLALTEEHWKAVTFAREDYAATGEAPTLRRMDTAGGISTKDMFRLFPKKPAKKLAYVAGLPKPVGCV